MFTFLTQIVQTLSPSHGSPGLHAEETPVQTHAEAVGEHGEMIGEAGHHAAEAATHESAFNMSELISHHLSDENLWGVNFEIMGFDMSITKRVVMMWITSLLLFAVFIPAARKIAKNIYGRPSRFTGTVEVFVNFIRNDVARGSMGSHSKPYEPFLLTLFFFILFSNLIGLLPPLGEIANIFAGGGHGAHGEIPFLVKLWPAITATGDIGVTAVLAIFSFIAIIMAGFIHQGIAFIKNIVPAGIHWSIWPILWPIEAIGLLTKPFALAIRLLANMTAGHMIILVFIGFIFEFQSYGVALVSIPGSIAIYMLEIFVGFLQAYIFVFLTALFIASVQHRH